MYSGVQNVFKDEHLLVSNVPCKTEGCMVDTLVSRSDEGRDMAAIRFGEAPNSL